MAYSNLQIFTVELVGTFILVVFATGSIVLDAEMFNGELGIPFHAVAPFIALLIGVYSFGKVKIIKDRSHSYTRFNIYCHVF